jgi:hypothetical protein
VHDLDQAVHLLAVDLAPLHGEAVLDVLAHGLPGEQAELLEDHRHLRLGPGDLLAVDGQAAVRDVEQPAEGPQQRGLAAARRPDDADELVLGHLQ